MTGSGLMLVQPALKSPSFRWDKSAAPWELSEGVGSTVGLPPNADSALSSRAISVIWIWFPFPLALVTVIRQSCDPEVSHSGSSPEDSTNSCRVMCDEGRLCYEVSMYKSSELVHS